jgi:hypothetical protein
LLITRLIYTTYKIGHGNALPEMSIILFVAYFAKVRTVLSIYYFEHNVTAAEVELLKHKVADVIRLLSNFIACSAVNLLFEDQFHSFKLLFCKTLSLCMVSIQMWFIFKNGSWWQAYGNFSRLRNCLGNTD